MLLRRPDLRSERGASALEYAFLISGIAAVVVVAVMAIGRVTSAQTAQVGSCVTSTSCTQPAAATAP